MDYTKLEDLLNDGMTRKQAGIYLDYFHREEKMDYLDQDFVKWAHSKGFIAENAAIYGITPENYENYLSDYDNMKLWPLNNWTRMWVNDKLTLKYMLYGTPYEELMPKYYYYTQPEGGGLRALVDNPIKDSANTDDSFINVLKEVGEFACKPNNGSSALGFFKLEYKEGIFFINEKEVDEQEIKNFVTTHPNYIFTEFVYAGRSLGKICHKPHTIRLLVVNENGNNPVIGGGFIKIPTSRSGVVNMLNFDNPNDYNLISDIDVETGWYGHAKLTFINRIVDVECHPDSGERIDGYVEDYPTLKEMVLGVAKQLCTIEYIGFDICVTEDGFKCFEINSHSWPKHMQIFGPIGEKTFLNGYYKRKLTAIDQLSVDDKKKRIEIQR